MVKNFSFSVIWKWPDNDFLVLLAFSAKSDNTVKYIKFIGLLYLIELFWQYHLCSGNRLGVIQISADAFLAIFGPPLWQGYDTLAKPRKIFRTAKNHPLPPLEKNFRSVKSPRNPLSNKIFRIACFRTIRRKKF